mmetsp:Transcript_42024/g.90267  ORF Transcript_42024/g.90267 Transcript_42024/m.90267 type:complete len:799 (+) Transcript_42024:135-2531(+)
MLSWLLTVPEELAAAWGSNDHQDDAEVGKPGRLEQKDATPPIAQTLVVLNDEGAPVRYGNDPSGRSRLFCGRTIKNELCHPKGKQCASCSRYSHSQAPASRRSGYSEKMPTAILGHQSQQQQQQQQQASPAIPVPSAPPLDSQQQNLHTKLPPRKQPYALPQQTGRNAPNGRQYKTLVGVPVPPAASKVAAPAAPTAASHCHSALVHTHVPPALAQERVPIIPEGSVPQVSMHQHSDPSIGKQQQQKQQQEQQKQGQQQQHQEPKAPAQKKASDVPMTSGKGKAWRQGPPVPAATGDRASLVPWDGSMLFDDGPTGPGRLGGGRSVRFSPENRESLASTCPEAGATLLGKLGELAETASAPSPSTSSPSAASNSPALPLPHLDKTGVHPEALPVSVGALALLCRGDPVVNLDQQIIQDQPPPLEPRSADAAGGSFLRWLPSSSTNTTSPLEGLSGGVPEELFIGGKACAALEGNVFIAPRCNVAMGSSLLDVTAVTASGKVFTFPKSFSFWQRGKIESVHPSRCSRLGGTKMVVRTSDMGSRIVSVCVGEAECDIITQESSSCQVSCVVPAAAIDGAAEVRVKAENGNVASGGRIAYFTPDIFGLIADNIKLSPDRAVARRASGVDRSVCLGAKPLQRTKAGRYFEIQVGEREKSLRALALGVIVSPGPEALVGPGDRLKVKEACQLPRCWLAGYDRAGAIFHNDGEERKIPVAKWRPATCLPPGSTLGVLWKDCENSAPAEFVIFQDGQERARFTASGRLPSPTEELLAVVDLQGHMQATLMSGVQLPSSLSTRRGK